MKYLYLTQRQCVSFKREIHETVSFKREIHETTTVLKAETKDCTFEQCKYI